MGFSGSGATTLVLLSLCAAVSCSKPLPPPEMLHESFAGKSEFRTVNRKRLESCLNRSPYLQINVSTGGAPLPDEVFIKVTVAGVLKPDGGDWVAMITPSNSSVSGCPLSGVNYVQTGDLAHLPLLCHYPVKAQHLTSDPGYLGCKNAACQRRDASGACKIRTCAATLTFHVVNFRTDVEFVLFSGGFRAPCVLKRSGALRFATPARPLYGHLSSTGSNATSMRITWVSGDGRPQQVQYGAGNSAASQVATFTQKDMCSIAVLPSPAKDFGWHDPGYIHSAVMTGLQPSQSYSYRYGSDSVGWSDTLKFRTPPSAGSDELSFVIYGDMGKAPLDPSVEHYIQPGSISVTKAVAKEIQTGNVDSIFHIGDISYATGFLVEWDFFLHLITPLASQVSYMTAIGNHERDYADSGSVYVTPDSGGECGVAYESYFPMPTVSKDKPWYAIEQGSAHFVVMSTEHEWSEKSEQHNWMEKDLSSVNRSRTPWVIFIGHRPMYSSHIGIPLNVDPKFVASVEPLLLKYQVDLVFFGHVHNYERTCAVYQSKCKVMPRKDASGIDTYDNSNYTAPIHALVGAGGFSLDNFPKIVWAKWSLARVSEFGYARVHATRTDILVQFVSSSTMEVRDQFRIVKQAPARK
ncbi:nucleotide pyrophosphatase/phosphodiesterase-like [Phragmites australis]|uniref:nucleotide pyrophosphatase/phosphodiesterase-like n=1 Tax=Phragmites australis TaxID=29695 RepID=UPI002D79029F|nr:nucleotide pyrophosphatase/phosphodiesterase-like [Phragmites australis]